MVTDWTGLSYILYSQLKTEISAAGWVSSTFTKTAASYLLLDEQSFVGVPVKLKLKGKMTEEMMVRPCV